jgi:ParB family chromosome partitioning protein
MLGVEKIRRGTYQPRRLFDQSLLQELADSIQAQGMIQPIIVRTFADGYELVAGERRWRAAQMAGIDRVPAIVREMQDQSVAAVSLIENIQRKDLNPLEEAAAFERLCDEFGMTHKAVAESVGRSRASVTNLMRLLELNEEVKLMIDRGELEMGHARALLGAPKDQQFDVALKIVKQGMSVRAVEKYIKSLNTDAGEPAGSADSPVDDPDIERLSQKLSETLGAKVHIQHRSNGGGKLQISYSSVSELQGILAHIK